MKLGKRQQARRISPPPVQEAMPPPRQPMASFATGPYDVPPQGPGPEGPPIIGYAPDGTPIPAYGPDGSPTMGYPLDGPQGPWAPDVPQWMPPGPDGSSTMGYAPGGPQGPWAPESPSWVGDATGGFPSMAYAYAPDGTPLLYAPDAPPPGFDPNDPTMGWPQEQLPAQPPMAPPPDLGYQAPPQDMSYAVPPPSAVAAPAPTPAVAEVTAAPEPPAPDPRSARAVEQPVVTAEPEVAEASVSDDAPPWPDFAPVNRVAVTGEGGAAGVERLPTATQAHRMRLGRPVDADPLTRTSEARIGRLHLRGGMLGLARASLEHLAGVETLDRAALVDLAEARWRTGDLEGAAEAADAHIQASGDEPMARIIAAELAARDGHILDARQLATQVQGQVGDGLERMFAGEPRSAVWPPATPGWMDVGAVLGGRFGLLVGGAEVADPNADTWPTAPMAGMDDARIAPASSVLVHTSPDPEPFTLTTTDPVEAGREADRELQAAERDLARGDMVALADRLGLLLRRDPALAPVILSITEHALAVGEERTSAHATDGEPSTPADAQPGPAAGGPVPVTPGMASLQMLRGDILRGLGNDADATRAYQEALRALPGRSITREST
jgi:hypothetical protein